MSQREQENQEDHSGTVLAPERPRVGPPRQYNVILLNDDYTPMEFVVEILMAIFSHNPLTASKIMLNIHEQGRGLAGVFTKDIAETKIVQVHETARLSQHPLRCVMEQA